jgi:imidazolonepropionase
VIDVLISPCKQLLSLCQQSDEPVRRPGKQNLGLIEDGALGINITSGVVEYCGPRAELPQDLLNGNCPRIDASSSVVMPGFVDSHTHLVFAGSRAAEFYQRASGVSYQEIARTGGGIARTMDATRKATADELYDLSNPRLKALCNNGTTALEIKSGYGLSPQAELKQLEVIQRLRDNNPNMISSTYLGAHLIPPEYNADRDKYVEQVISQLTVVSENSLADNYDIFVDPLAFSLEEAKQIVDSGAAGNLALKLHGDEFSDNNTAAWAAEVGALSCDHLGGIGDDGIEALADSSTIATLLPTTMFFSGHGKYAPARRMIEAGCAVALASDLNPGSSLVYSMPFTMTLAVLEMQMSAEECIIASTINGAHALGLSSFIGSFETGKRADVLILDLPDYLEIPYHLGRDFVRDIFIRGRAVKSNGKFIL